MPTKKARASKSSKSKMQRGQLESDTGCETTSKPILALRRYSIDELTLDPDNVRQHHEPSLVAITASLKQFGQQRPIVVQANTNIVLAGNGTVQAAAGMGWNEIWGVECDLQGATARAYAFADNRTGELSRWNFELVAEAALRIIQNCGKPIEAALGFTEKQAREILRAASQDDIASELEKLRYDENDDTFFVRAYDVPLSIAEQVRVAMAQALESTGSPGSVRIHAKHDCEQQKAQGVLAGEKEHASTASISADTVNEGI